MKKIFGFLGLAALTVSLTGCLGKDGDDVQNVSTVTRAVLNHLSPVDGEDEIVVSRGEYTLRFDNVSNLVVVSSGTIRYKNADHSMRTGDLSFSAAMYNLGGYAGQVFQWRGGEGNNAAAGYPTVTGLRGKMSDLYYFDNVLQIPELGPMNTNVLSRLNLSYTYDNLYNVTTFYPDMMFAGETSTTVSEGADPYKSSTPRYRVVINWEEKTASMVIYNAKFNPQMPEMTALLLKGLSVEWTPTGYIITGENIVAGQVENGQATPVPAFPFTSIKVETTSADMTQAKIDYVVGGRFHGVCNGAYVWYPSN